MRPALPVSPRRARRAVITLALVAPVLLAASRDAPGLPPQIGRIIVDHTVRDSMDSIWVRSNKHWDELADQNTLTQMLGAGKPTQREYLGCMQGDVSHDTLFVTGTVPARHMIQLQFAVTGTCDSVPDFVGTWHTHPYRAAPDGHALKEAGLSEQDLSTFDHGVDAAVLVVWDVDSIDAAARGPDGSVLHPVPVRMK